MSCSVTVTDTKTNQYWTGSGNAGPEDLTSAIVAFSPNPIETGASKSDPGSIFVPVTATVAPKDLASNVSVSNFTTLPGGSGAASVENSQPDSSTGQINFDLYGTAGTARGMPNGDVKIEAKDGSAVLGSAMVIIEVPAAIGTPHDQPSGAVTPTNADWNSASIPALVNVPPTKCVLVTWVGTSVTMKVFDQFGNLLSSIYNGQIVNEEDQGTNTFLPINEKITGGIYSDTVFFYTESSQAYNVGSPQANAWPTSNQHFQIASPQSMTQNIQVQIAGFTLDPSIVNRKVSYNNGTLTVTWP